MRQMCSPFAALTTDDDIFLDPGVRFLSAEELDGARAESARRGLTKESLEADMKAAGERLGLTPGQP